MRDRLSASRPDDPLLLYVGRLGAEKKLDRLRSVLEANPGARLAIVGSGPAEESLRRHFNGLPVHFAGQLVGASKLLVCKQFLLIVSHVSGRELSEAFASADLFVLPSDTETLGFVALEAAASGLPGVGVAGGGVVDVVQHGDTGFLASNEDGMQQFSAHVGRLIRDKSLCANMSSAAAEWAKGWSWAAATDKLRNVQYRKAMQLHECRVTGGRLPRDIEQAIMRATV